MYARGKHLQIFFFAGNCFSIVCMHVIPPFSGKRQESILACAETWLFSIQRKIFGWLFFVYFLFFFPSSLCTTSLALYVFIWFFLDFSFTRCSHTISTQTKYSTVCTQSTCVHRWFPLVLFCFRVSAIFYFIRNEIYVKQIKMVFEYSKALLKILVAIGKEIDFDWFIMRVRIYRKVKLTHYKGNEKTTFDDDMEKLEREAKQK